MCYNAGMKACTSCGVVQPSSEFYKDRSKKDGLRSHCRSCTRAYNASPARKAVNRKYNAKPEAIASRQRYAATPKGQAARAKYVNSEPAKRKKAARTYIWNRSPQGKASFKKYAQSLKGKLAAANRNRGRGGRWTPDDVYQQYVDQMGVCIDCLKPFTLSELEREHDTPFVRGGRNEFSNLLLMCRNCNASKHTKTYAEFQEWKVIACPPST